MDSLPADVLRFLKENAPTPLVADTDLTAPRAATQWNVSEPTAFARLQELVKAGKLKTDQRRSPNGRMVTIYFPKKGGDRNN